MTLLGGNRVHLLAVPAVLAWGCFAAPEELIRAPSASWSRRDCLTVIAAFIRHNINDGRCGVQAIVTPFVPKVVEALAGMRRLDDTAASGDSPTRYYLDLLMKSGAGLYVDRQNGARLVNARGNYYRHPRELDSLLFMVSLKNRSWPCAVPRQNVEVMPGVYATRPLASLADWPCYVPEIHDLDRRIFLLSAAGDTLRPKFLWGRRNALLTTEEHLFVMFDFTTRGGRRFVGEDAAVTMVVTGFDGPIRLVFSLGGT